MLVTIPETPQLTPVPVATWAPWLARRSSKMRLTADYVVIVDGITYTVPCGYITDGASIPRCFWWLWPPYGTDSMIAAVLHDYMYSHLFKVVTKDRADLIFYHTMRQCGASELKAKLFYKAVQYGGKGGW